MHNIASVQDTMTVRESPAHAREMVLLLWDLIPTWANEEKTHYSMTNDRAELVASKPAYRAAFRKHRCLIPVIRFYEWKPFNGYKQPYVITLIEGEVFSLAGLWEYWEGPTCEVIDFCSVVVTDTSQ